MKSFWGDWIEGKRFFGCFNRRDSNIRPFLISYGIKYPLLTYKHVYFYIKQLPTVLQGRTILPTKHYCGAFVSKDSKLSKIPLFIHSPKGWWVGFWFVHLQMAVGPWWFQLCPQNAMPVNYRILNWRSNLSQNIHNRARQIF